MKIKIIFLTFIFILSIQKESVYGAALFDDFKNLKANETIDFLRKKNISSDEILAMDKKDEKLLAFFLRQLKEENAEATASHFKDEKYFETLEKVYNYFNTGISYDAILLSDVVKRCSLQYMQQVILNHMDNFKEVLNPKRLKNFKLLTPHLEALYGDKISGLTWKTDLKSQTIDLLETSQRLWETHGYREVNNGYRGLAEVLKKYRYSGKLSETELLKNKDSVGLALRILNTEELYSIALVGSLKFLENNGDISKVKMLDNTYLYSILSSQECAKINFPPLGLTHFQGSSLLAFFGKTQVNDLLKISALWMADVFF